MSKNQKIIAVVIIAVVVALVGWRAYQKQEQPGTIKIGGIFALTGLGASQGEQELKGVQLAVEEVNGAGGINGRPVELVVGDASLDKLSAAASVAHKLIDIDKVVAIVGTTWDEPAQAILPIIEEAEVPMVGQNQTRILKKDKPYSYFFSTWYNNEVGIKELLSFAEKRGLKRVAIIRPMGAGFYEYVRDIVLENALQFNIDVIEDMDLNNPAISDFRTPLAIIKSANPDAILMVLNGFTECPLLKQASELKLNVPVLSTEAAQDYPSLKQCPALMQNLYFSYPRETYKYSDFEKKYQLRFNTEPETPSVMTAYDALKIIARALKQTNGEGGEKLREAIAGVKNYQGVSLESITFDNIGYVQTPPDAFGIRTIKNGQFVTLEK